MKLDIKGAFEVIDCGFQKMDPINRFYRVVGTDLFILFKDPELFGKFQGMGSHAACANQNDLIQAVDSALKSNSKKLYVYPKGGQ